MFKLDTARQRVIAAGGTAAGLAALVLVLQPFQATGQTAAAETLTFKAKDGTFRLIDMAPKGEHPSAGDYFAITSRLFKGGERIGTLHATCLVTRRTANPANTPLLCQGVYRLPGGKLAGTALLVGENPVTRIAITGGTGQYAGASGVSVEESGEGPASTVTITLQ
jgi:hypothetical protein